MSQGGQRRATPRRVVNAFIWARRSHRPFQEAEKRVGTALTIVFVTSVAGGRRLCPPYNAITLVASLLPLPVRALRVRMIVPGIMLP